jgi:hypothetical protein
MSAPATAARARSLASVVHGALTLALGLAIAFFQHESRAQLADLARVLPGVTKQPLAEGSALGLCGVVVFVLGLTQLHTGMTSDSASEAFVVAEAALTVLLGVLASFRSEPFFFYAAAEPALFCLWGVVELALRERKKDGAAASDAGTAGASAAMKAR